MTTNKKIWLVVCILLLKLLSFSAVLPNSAKLITKKQRQKNSQTIPNSQDDILGSQNLKNDKKYILNGLS